MLRALLIDVVLKEAKNRYFSKAFAAALTLPPEVPAWDLEKNIPTSSLIAGSIGSMCGKAAKNPPKYCTGLRVLS
jgi:hypothetical protein